MLETIYPCEFNRPTDTGKTKPSFVTCLRGNGERVEVVAKFSEGCEEKEINLATEVVSAWLAADVGLPVPKPYLLQVDPAWVETIPDRESRDQIRASSPIAFGSTNVGNGFHAWSRDERISHNLLPTALAVFVFDAMTQNPDRRSDVPNCLVRGDRIFIFDHELCFRHRLMLEWKEPWEVGSLQGLKTPGAHIFYNGLRKRSKDLQPVRVAWSSLSDSRLEEYHGALPAEWGSAHQRIEQALELVAGVRDNIDRCLGEVERVLA